MDNYICEKCNKSFKKKYHYNRHIDKKVSCIVKENFKTTNNDIKKINISKPILKWVGGKHKY
jgi:hypothetical protein